MVVEVSNVKLPLVAWRHQAITWTNVDLSSFKCWGIHRRALSWEDLKIPISKTRLKIPFLESQLDVPEANDLKIIKDIHVFTFCIIFWILFNRRRPDSQWSNPTCSLFCTINNIPADAVVTQGAGASAGMVNDQLSKNIPSIASEELALWITMKSLI